MDEVNKTIRYNNLLSLYEELLSPTQKVIMNDYFAYDLSLSEIAANRSVSRSAIEDALKKGMAKLESLEQQLHLLEKKEEILKNTAEIRRINQNSQISSLLDDIERKLN